MEKWMADDEPVVKLSSYLRLHELRGVRFGFVKIAGEDARGETLERPDPLPSSSIERVRGKKKGKRRERGTEITRKRESAFSSPEVFTKSAI